ncbi:TetR/AcrR family transcriptional regulator [Treponema sp.]|uniref:TetR/AcrR family transcriptional regulator n=1 Tax=Treponema sp. TaxID=166 RepID=UPI0025E35E57|nr:TetR/AcrR family transcriptional regulator [Treponema sp.]MBR4321550.1 TetR/AcrR family transcriptional regulator [Treponema sp.]
MAIVVEHDKRKHEILEKSLELFTREGYDDVTFQKIADACGITRTTLYIYFKNKREIFTWSIKQMTGELESRLMEILGDKNLSAEECLRQLMYWVIDTCNGNRPLFNVLLIYLINLQKTGASAEERVNRRVIRIKHLLSMIIIEGQKRGEFKKMPVKTVNNMLYSLVESAIFEIAVLNKKDVSEVKDSIDLVVQGLRK